MTATSGLLFSCIGVLFTMKNDSEVSETPCVTVISVISFLLFENVSTDGGVFTKGADNSPHSNFRSKTRPWGQNHKNKHKFCVTTDMTFVAER